MDTKKNIRNKMLDIRRAMGTEEVTQKSHVICNKVITQPFFLCAEEIWTYVGFHNEVQTGEIIETAWALNKKVAVPKIERDTMCFYYIHSYNDLTAGYNGILEPKTGREEAACEVPFIIVPVVAFDDNQNRIGFGGGYYDQFLSRHHLSTHVALAYSLQKAEAIPADDWDYRLSRIITEDKIYEQFT